MNIQIKNSCRDPIYLQIVNQLRDAIVQGDLAENERLPSIRLLAKELRVSVITTKRAYDDLEREGYIHSVQGKGSFVAPQNKALMEEKLLRKIEACLSEALHYADLADLTHEDLVGMLTVLEEEDEEGD